MTVGDFVELKNMQDEIVIRGRVVEIFFVGAKVAPYNDQGVRLLAKSRYFGDSHYYVAKVNGHALF